MLPAVNGEFRCAADPELRFAPSGVAVGKIRAVASSRKQVDGEWVDDKTCWVNLTGFKQVAENMAESFSKGDLVVVSGRVQTDDWEDSDGNKRTSINILVDTIGPSVRFAPARHVAADRPASSGSGGGQQSGSKATPAEDPWTTTGGGAAEEPPF